MKADLLLLLAALSAGTLSCATVGARPAPPAPAGDADPCAAIESLPGPESCGGPLCSPRQRVRVACGLRDAMASRYVFFSVKPRLLSDPGKPEFDARRHLDACAAEERARPREDDPLRFYDRVRRCTAAFEDGHLLVSVPERLPQVALGIGLRLAADGKVHVAWRDPRLLAWLEAGRVPGANDLLAPGAEVVAIDGRAAVDAVDELGRLVPASSDAARAEKATDALTRRDFAYPARRTAALTIAVNGAERTVELPWWLAPGASESPIARAYARRTGIATTDLLDWRPEAKGAWARDGAPADGLVRGDPILPRAEAERLLEYRGDAGQLAARLGEAAGPAGAPYCYAQLLTFQTESLARAGTRRAFGEVVEEFVRGCDERGRDLVLDLRQNEGGYISHSSTVAAMLTPRDRTTPGGALLLRATARNERVYRERAPADPGASSRSDAGRILDAIREAREARQEFTNAFLDHPLAPGGAAGGFEGRVIALVAPTCMSACDRLAGLLRSGGRALLVGGPTEGAGASQQETRDLSARWTDGDRLLSVSIPNAAMGVQPEALDGASADDFFSALAIENRPVEPHVPYETTVEDLTGANRGWRELVDAALGAPRPAPAAGEPATDRT